MCPVVGGQRPEEGAGPGGALLVVMATREQQTALHIRQHSAEEATEEGCVAGDPTGRVPAPGRG